MRRSSRALLALATFSSTLVVAVGVSTLPVSAQSDLTLAVSSPAVQLAGDPSVIPVTVTADNPNGGDGLPAFNGSFAVILPAGAVFNSGPIAPETVTTLPDGRTALFFENVGDIQEGSSLALDFNIELPAAQFPVGSTVDIDASFGANSDPRTVPDFDAITGTVSGDTSGNVPSAAGATLLTPLEIEKMSPTVGAEDEMLRGVHDHVNTYTLDVTNTEQGPTPLVIVEDFIPATLEFLGCGDVDNTSDAVGTNPGNVEEYPGAPTLDAGPDAPAPCPAPASVETVQVTAGVITASSNAASVGVPGPDSAMPDGVYTRVVWNLVDLAAAGVDQINYQVGIPIKENVIGPEVFPGGADPTANLDNNTGPFTTETGGELPAQNFASVAGVYGGATAPGFDPLTDTRDTADFQVSVEDLSIHKDAVVPDPILQGSTVDYILTVETGEYKNITNATIVDVLGDGQCPFLGGPDPETTAPLSGDCVGGTAPANDGTATPFTNITENADGSWDLQWDFTTVPSLVNIPINSVLEYTFTAAIRDSFQENFDDDAPFNGADGLQNDVDIDGTSNIDGVVPDDPAQDGVTVLDESGFSFSAGTAEIDKTVSRAVAAPGTLDCSAATFVRTNPSSTDSLNQPAALEGEPYAYRIGDRVCFRVGIDFVGDLNFRNARVDDFLPDGMVFEMMWQTAGAVSEVGETDGNETGATADNLVLIDSVEISPSPQGDAISWFLGAQDPDTVGGAFENDLFVSNGGERFEAIFSAVVTENPADRTTADIKENLQKFTTSNIAGDTVSLRDNADFQVVQPNLRADKSVTPTTATQGQPVSYTSSITNIFSDQDTTGGGNFDASFARAVNVSAWDVLPVGVTCAFISNITVEAPATGTAGCVDGAGPSGRSIIDIVIDEIDPQATADVTYELAIPTGTPAGSTLTNDVGVRQYEQEPTNGPDTGAFPEPVFVPSSNIDPSQEASANMPPADADATVTTPGPEIDKTQQSSFGDSSNDRNATLATTDEEVVVGETLQYQTVSTVAEGTTTFNQTIADTLPAGQRLLQIDSATFDDGAGTVIDLLVAPGPFTITPGPTGWDIAFPGQFDNPSGTGDDIFTVTYTVVIEDVATNIDGQTLTNDAQITFDNAPTGGTNFVTDSPPVDANVIEPQLEVDIDKTLADGSTLSNPTCDTTPGNDTAGSDDPDGTLTDGCDVEAGAEVTQTITVTNSGSANAYETTVVATVPAGLEPLDGPGGAPVADGGTVTGPNGEQGTWDATARTITWDPATVPALVGPIEPGTPVTIDFNLQLDPSAGLTAGQDFTTSVDIPTYSPLPPAEQNADTPLYGNDATATRGAVDPDEDTIEVHFPQISVNKIAIDDFTDARLDQPFQFRLVITNSDATATAFDVDVTDQLPAGWNFDATSGTPSDPDDPAASPLVWTDVFDVPPSSTLNIDYTATPDSTVLVPAGVGYDLGTGPEAVPHTNMVVIEADDATGASGNADGPYIDTDDQTVFIRKTDLEIAKAITSPVLPADVFFGSFIEYTITLTNQGPDEATGVEVTDTDIAGQVLNSTILFDSVSQIDRGSYDDTTGVWTVGSIADGETLELVLRARLNTVDPPAPAQNDVSVTASDQFDIDSTPGPLATPRTPVEDEEATVSISPLPTTLGNFVWLDLNEDGIQDPGEPGIPGVPVRVDFADPDGELRRVTITTDAAGNWNVPTSFTDELTGDTVFLPVNVDVTATVDPDGAGAPLGGGNLNLAGLTPTLAGQESVPGADDGSEPDGVADGQFTEQVQNNQTTLPDGTVGRFDYDFGFIGTVDLGDRVWWDADQSGDSTDDDPATATEPGIAGATVTATWAGFDGVAGTADDIVLTTTTGANGDYLFTSVPPGEYDIVVDTSTAVDVNGNPLGLSTQTFDRDGTLDNMSNTTVGATDVLDQDFSYIGPGAIGDTVWYDANGDGVQDANEPGIGGVDVDVTWLGPDGVAGGGDDFTITVTTANGTTDDLDGDGNIDPPGFYIVDGLPFGEYDVTVDTTTLPGSMTETFDFDGGLDSTSHTTLTPANFIDLDQDFGYQGTLDLGDMVWYDVGNDGNAAPDAGDLPLPGVDVTVTWAGADGTFGTPDDFVATVTTSDGTVDTNGDGNPEALGDYLISNLPDGEYRIDVDPATLPEGISVETFDFDGAGDDSSRTTLAGADDLDQDFSYTGVGSIGDTVWFDHNGDGVQDAGEPGMGGVTVDLLWGGLDGIIGTADDEIFTTTTAPDGTYLFPNLPFGDFEVTVDDTTLPAGLQATFDADGIGTPNTSAVSLDAVNPIDLDQDFGYNGLGSVGDTVFFDINGDGVDDPTDPGIPGVDLIVAWPGADGVPGTADDFVTTVTTDANGNYTVPNLPFEDIIVGVVPPPGFQATFDDDGGLDNTSTTTLDAATNPDDVDQDFGLTGTGSMGDLVWYDQDDSGTPGIDGPGDQGIPNVVVDVIWAGLDGVIGTADDVAFATTTDAAGNWNLDNLPAGNYTAVVDPTTLPDAITTPTFDRDGTPDGSAEEFPLADGETLLDVDFSFTGGGSVGDTIFIDLNADGVQDPADVGLGGVTVTITFDGPAGPTTLTTTTDADGKYLFENLPFDVPIAVTVDDTTLPPGVAQSSDPDGTLDNTSVVTLDLTNPSDLDQDFGYNGVGTIGDTLFFDANADNDPEPEAADGDIGLAGVTVELEWINPTGGLNMILRTTTDADGKYLFEGLPDGDFVVRVDPDGDTLPGFDPHFDPDGGADNESAVNLAGGASDLDQDFSYIGTGSLGDMVWFDTNGDGVIDPGEVPLEGVLITLTFEDPVIGTVFTLTTTTDVNGNYLFPNLPPGDYTVTADPSALATPFAPTFDLDGIPDGTTTTTLGDGEDKLDVDFGFRPEATIVGVIFEDTNNNGIQDPGEPGIPGVDVVVTDSTGNPVTVTTDADGRYSVSGLLAGDVTVDVVDDTLPPDVMLTTGNDPHTVNAIAGTTTPAEDIGYVKLGAVLGRVWFDIDGAGDLDPEDIDLGGVTMQLFDPDGNLVATALTGPDGMYRFDDVPLGPYTIKADKSTLPPGLDTETFDPDGVLDNEVSFVLGDLGVDPDGTPVSIDDPPPGGRYTALLDFAFTGSGSAGDTVFLDPNGNGIQDPGDTGVEGVVIDLVWAGPDGVFGTADDVTMPSATTGPDGQFVFPNLPAGNYRATVDESTLPDDVALTTPNSFVFSLAAGQNLIDAGLFDFGLRSTAIAFTGSTTFPVVVGGLLLLMIGFVALFLARRRRGY